MIDVEGARKSFSYHDGFLLDGDRKTFQLLREGLEKLRPRDHQVLLLLLQLRLV